MTISADFSRLQGLLDRGDGRDPVLNLAELQGFFYGQVITPEEIQPQDWLPLILDDQQAASIDLKQEQLLLEALVEIYDRFEELRQAGQLHFPYSLKLPSEKTVSDALDWAFGFNLALEMRPEIWFGNDPRGQQGNDRTENLIVSFSVVRGIAWPDEIENLFGDAGSPALEQDECELLATLLVALPEAVNIIQEYASSLAARSIRIGRNEPCPCGSGKRYRECCSDRQFT